MLRLRVLSLASRSSPNSTEPQVEYWRTLMLVRSFVAVGDGLFFLGFHTMFSIKLRPTKSGSLRSHISGGVLRIGQVAANFVRRAPGATPNPAFQRTASGRR
jgi:hypothetical protein